MNKRKTAFLIVRIDVMFKEKLQKEANRLGFKTVSDFVRDVLSKGL